MPVSSLAGILFQYGYSWQSVLPSAPKKVASDRTDFHLQTLERDGPVDVGSELFLAVHGDDLHVAERTVKRVGRDTCNGIYDLLPLDDLAEYRVFAIQMR